LMLLIPFKERQYLQGLGAFGDGCDLLLLNEFYHYSVYEYGLIVKNCLRKIVICPRR
jgi:hypothetical protein